MNTGKLTLQLIMPVRRDTQSKKRALEAKKYYEAKGFKVVTPFDIAESVDDVAGNHDEAKIQAACLYFLSDADVAVILPGWESSEGCINEITFATAHGIPLYYYKSNIRVFFNTQTKVEIESQRPGDIITPEMMDIGKPNYSGLNADFTFADDLKNNIQEREICEKTDKGEL